ncbi:22396_t:CDS:10, partial [Racocetra persica]
MWHKYFERAYFQWNILEFLKECEVEPFDRKISCYIACLETIANNEEGCRRERAQYLLDQYRKASTGDSPRSTDGPKPDYKRARNWERERVYGSIYLHQPTFVDGNLSGTVNNGTIGTVNGIVSGSSKREVQVPDNQDNDKVPKRTRIDDYFPVRWRDQQPRTPEHQIYPSIYPSGFGFPCVQKNDIENSYDMRFYEDININEDIYVDEILLSQEATDAPANIMNVSNILNDPESSEIASTILTTPHSYNISNILNDSSNELVEKSITPTSPSPYYKQPRFITNNEYMDMVWSPWHFDKIIGEIDIEKKIIGLCEKEKKAKIKSSLNYGIIDLNDSRIMNVLGPSVKVYFEAEMKKYKPQRSVSKEALETLKYFNVTSLSELGKALSNITINYENPNRDTGVLNLDSSELQEGWYNSNIVAPFFDDCLASLNDCILRRGEVESKAQKLLGIKSSKKPKYDGILSFNRKIEFIYVETVTTSILSKRDKDLSKLHEAIVIMFKLIVSSLPEKIVHEISDLPILCIQFCGTTADVYLANWPVNMRPVVFSIFEFDIPEQVTSLPSLTKSA